VSFKDYFGLKIKEPVKKRHMHPIGRDPMSHSKTPGKFVPDMWKTKNDTVEEFESLKQSAQGQRLINHVKAAKLKIKFPLKSDGMLGNTGISLTQHPANPNLFIIKKEQ
jgi:hypothetical protein